MSATRAFALHGDSGALLYYDGRAWNATEGYGFGVFEADPQPGSGRVFAATDKGVFMSLDNGATWANASKGLPATPPCSDLRIAEDGKGGHDLYLATYGRSVWKTSIDFMPKGPDFQHIPQQVGDVLAGVLGDGGGLVRIDSQIVPIPPNDPAMRDMLGALAIMLIHLNIKGYWSQPDSA